MAQNALLASASSVVLTVLTDAGATLAAVQQVQAFVVNAVQWAEASGKSGADKLQAVLMATEVFVNDALPALKVQWNSLSVQIKSFVAGVVSLFNAVGIFVKTVAEDVNKAIGEVKSAVVLPSGGQVTAQPAATLQNAQGSPQKPA